MTKKKEYDDQKTSFKKYIVLHKFFRLRNDPRD